MSKQQREKLMSFEQIKEARERVAAKLKNLENTDDPLELTLEELSAISGGNGGNPLTFHGIFFRSSDRQTTPIPQA